jgi:hypothetical protein
LACDEIAAARRALRPVGRVPAGQHPAINVLGLNAVFVPEAYGGAGLI